MGRRVWRTGAAAIVLALLLQSPAMASEHYQVFRFDWGGMPMFTPRSLYWGFGAYVEPNFSVLDSLSLGIRLEFNTMFPGDVRRMGPSPNFVGMNFMAKANYFFLDGTIRPFIGLAMGADIVGDLEGQAAGGAAGTATTYNDLFGGYYFALEPQVGIQIGPVRLALAYTAVTNCHVKVYHSNGISVTTHESSDWVNAVAIEIGSWFGGRRIEKTDRRDEADEPDKPNGPEEPSKQNEPHEPSISR